MTNKQTINDLDDRILFDMWRFFFTQKIAIRAHAVVLIAAIASILYGIATQVWILLPVVLSGVAFYIVTFLLSGVCSPISKHQYLTYRKTNVEYKINVLKGEIQRFSGMLVLFQENPVRKQQYLMGNTRASEQDIASFQETFLNHAHDLETTVQSFEGDPEAKAEWTRQRDEIFDQLEMILTEYRQTDDANLRQIFTRLMRIQHTALFIAIHDATFLAIKNMEARAKQLRREHEVITREMEEIESLYNL